MLMCVSSLGVGLMCAVVFVIDDLRAEMRHLNVGPDLLSEVFKRFRDNRVMC